MIYILGVVTYHSVTKSRNIKRKICIKIPPHTYRNFQQITKFMKVISTEGVRIWLPDRLSTYLYFTGYHDQFISNVHSNYVSSSLTVYQCLIHVYGIFLGRDRNTNRTSSLEDPRRHPVSSCRRLSCCPHGLYRYLHLHWHPTVATWLVIGLCGLGAWSSLLVSLPMDSRDLSCSTVSVIIGLLISSIARQSVDSCDLIFSGESLMLLVISWSGLTNAAPTTHRVMLQLVQWPVQWPVQCRIIFFYISSATRDLRHLHMFNRIFRNLSPRQRYIAKLIAELTTSKRLAKYTRVNAMYQSTDL